MTMSEWFCEHEWRRPKDNDTDFAGTLTGGDVNRLMKLVEEG